MRRAMILIAVITILSLTVAILMDGFQTTTAEGYLRELPEIRTAVLQNNMAEAYDRQALIYANWQHDASVMNYFISHHHTRAVSRAMLQLATALEMRWQEEALKAIDALQDALVEVQDGDFYKWENFF